MQWCEIQNRLVLFGFSGLLLALHVDFPYLALATGFACAIGFYIVETYVYPRLSLSGRWWTTTARAAAIFIVGDVIGIVIIGLPLLMRLDGPVDSLLDIRMTLGWGGVLGVGIGAVGTMLSSFQTLAAKQEEQERALAEAARKAAELRELAARAETRALRAQINPHFLYNALNTLAYLTEEDPPAARRVVEKLARIFRRTLERSADATTTLADELEFVADYLAIECERFDDVLRVRSIIDPATLRARVPCMMLQPLAENAVKHGICPVSNGGTLTVRTALVDDARGEPRLRITLEDDGRGMDDARLSDVLDGSAGAGFANVRDRLQLHYGSRATVSVRSRLGEGTVVTIECPYETAGVVAEQAVA